MCSLENRICELESFIFDYPNFADFINHGLSEEGNILGAKAILEQSLNGEEASCLLKCFFNKHHGWFLSPNKLGSRCLTLAAMHMDLAHSDYALFNKKERYHLSRIARKISEQQLALICSIYAKQKIATLRTLDRIRNERNIFLYRGLHDLNIESNIYYHNPLESFTTDKDVARFYAGSNGFVISKVYPVDQVLAYKTVYYRTPDIPHRNIKRAISRAKEYIVENKLCEFPLQEGVNKHSMNKE